MTTALSTALPKRGPEYDHSRPETRQAWMDIRRGGITATDIRDWVDGSRRREIITEKVTGEDREVSSRLREMFDYGVLRESMMGPWIEEGFGIKPCNAVYSHPDNPRHLASPDGISVDMFSGELDTGDTAALSEIKTSGVDLTPGKITDDVLVRIDPRSPFAKKRYYRQVQWQMYVMNAARTLFVWEIRAKGRDPETGEYVPDGEPHWCWIPRDQPFIDRLVTEADAALEEIDAAKVSLSLDGLPPSSDLPSEHAALVADYLNALDAEKVAAAAKKKAWDALNALYVGEGKPDVSIDGGFARVTVTTNTTDKRVVDMDAARQKAPVLVKKYEALVARNTRVVPTSRQGLTVTRKKS